MKKSGSTTGEPSDLESLPEDVQQAMARARKATEELPPLEELAALQEAMLGLAAMSAVVGRLRGDPCEKGGSAEDAAQMPGSTYGSMCPDMGSESADRQDD